MVDRVEEYTAVLSELLLVMDSFDELKIRKSHQAVVHIAHGWYMRVQRGIDAVMALERDGYAGEAAPLRRSVIEHVVGLQWLAAEGNQINEAIRVGHGDWVANLRKSLAGSVLLDEQHFDSVVDSVKDADQSMKYLNKFVERANRYSDRFTLPGYFAETGQSHATYESALAYFDPVLKQFLGESRKIEPQAPFCAVQLLTALNSYAEIFDGDDVKLLIAEPAERIRLQSIRDRKSVV